MRGCGVNFRSLRTHNGLDVSHTCVTHGHSYLPNKFYHTCECGAELGAIQEYAKPWFVRTRGVYWIGWQSELIRDGWLINCFGIGLFVPNDWVWRMRDKLHLRRMPRAGSGKSRAVR